jgi:hypothetical protein
MNDYKIITNFEMIKLTNYDRNLYCYWPKVHVNDDLKMMIKFVSSDLNLLVNDKSEYWRLIREYLSKLDDFGLHLCTLGKDLKGTCIINSFCKKSKSLNFNIPNFVYHCGFLFSCVILSREKGSLLKNMSFCNFFFRSQTSFAFTRFESAEYKVIIDIYSKENEELLSKKPLDEIPFFVSKVKERLLKFDHQVLIKKSEVLSDYILKRLPKNIAIDNVSGNQYQCGLLSLQNILKYDNINISVEEISSMTASITLDSDQIMYLYYLFGGYRNIVILNTEFNGLSTIIREIRYFYSHRLTGFRLIINSGFHWQSTRNVSGIFKINLVKETLISAIDLNLSSCLNTVSEDFKDILDSAKELKVDDKLIKEIISDLYNPTKFHLIDKLPDQLKQLIEIEINRRNQIDTFYKGKIQSIDSFFKSNSMKFFYKTPTYREEIIFKTAENIKPHRLLEDPEINVEKKIIVDCTDLRIVTADNNPEIVPDSFNTMTDFVEDIINDQFEDDKESQTIDKTTEDDDFDMSAFDLDADESKIEKALNKDKSGINKRLTIAIAELKNKYNKIVSLEKKLLSDRNNMEEIQRESEKLSELLIKSMENSKFMIKKHSVIIKSSIVINMDLKIEYPEFDKTLTNFGNFCENLRSKILDIEVSHLNNILDQFKSIYVDQIQRFDRIQNTLSNNDMIKSLENIMRYMHLRHDFLGHKFLSMISPALTNLDVTFGLLHPNMTRTPDYIYYNPKTRVLLVFEFTFSQREFKGFISKGHKITSSKYYPEIYSLMKIYGFIEFIVYYPVVISMYWAESFDSKFKILQDHLLRIKELFDPDNESDVKFLIGEKDKADFKEMIFKFVAMNNMIYPRGKAFNFLLSNVKDRSLVNENSFSVIEYNTEMIDDFFEKGFNILVDKKEKVRIFFHYIFGKYKSSLNKIDVYEGIESQVMSLIPAFSAGKRPETIVDTYGTEYYLLMFILGSMGTPFWNSFKTNNTNLNMESNKIITLMEMLKVKIPHQYNNLQEIINDVYFDIVPEKGFEDIKIENLIMKRTEFEAGKYRIPQTDVIKYAKLDDQANPGPLFFPDRIIISEKSSLEYQTELSLKSKEMTKKLNDSRDEFIQSERDIHRFISNLDINTDELSKLKDISPLINAVLTSFLQKLFNVIFHYDSIVKTEILSNPPKYIKNLLRICDNENITKKFPHKFHDKFIVRSDLPEVKKKEKVKFVPYIPLHSDDLVPTSNALFRLGLCCTKKLYISKDVYKSYTVSVINSNVQKEAFRNYIIDKFVCGDYVYLDETFNNLTKNVENIIVVSDEDEFEILYDLLENFIKNGGRVTDSSTVKAKLKEGAIISLFRKYQPYKLTAKLYPYIRFRSDLYFESDSKIDLNVYKDIPIIISEEYNPLLIYDEDINFEFKEVEVIDLSKLLFGKKGEYDRTLYIPLAKEDRRTDIGVPSNKRLETLEQIYKRVDEHHESIMKGIKSSEMRDQIIKDSNYITFSSTRNITLNKIRQIIEEYESNERIILRLIRQHRDDNDDDKNKLDVLNIKLSNIRSEIEKIRELVKLF